MRTLEEIDNDIAAAKAEVPTGTQTEIYTRIVGYYRSLNNWNRGKRQEYSQRTHFEPSGKADDELAG